MKSKRTLMTMLVGMAMLATPLTAAAYDHNYANAHAAHAAHAEARNYNRAVRNGAVAAAAPRDFRADRTWGVREYGNYGRPYANRGYYGAPAYAAVPAYGGGVPGYAVGNGCGRGQSVVNTYYRDVNTGHRAAANDLLRQNEWAFHGGSGCGSAMPINGGMFGGLGGLFGQRAYNNYRPAYNGGGYGQPVGTSRLAPLLQYIR